MVKPLLGLLLLLCMPVHGLETIQAHTDQSRVYEQQSLVLTISADDQLDVGALDIRPLFRSFIVGEVRFASQSQGSRFSSQWQIPLLPLGTGAQQIPPLPVAGFMTQPITLQVLRGEAPKTQPRVLDVSLDHPTLLPHQVALYRIKLSQPPGVQIDAISPPSLNAARIRQIGDDVIDNEIIRGKRVRTLTRYYALTLEQAGEYVLQGPLVQGQDMSSRRQNTPFLQQGDNLALKVKTATTPTALISNQLTLESHWQPAKGPYRVGEPLLRVLTLKAEGTPLEQLPELALPELAGVRSYEDGGSSHESVVQGKLIAERVVRQAFIPQQPGAFSLPDLTLEWWNVTTERLETIRLAQPALNIDTATSTPSIAPLPDADADTTQWPWLTIGFATAWLVTLLIWWFTGRRLPSVPRLRYIDDKLSWRQLKRALQTEDPQLVHQALLVWGAQRWPQLQPTCLENLPCYPALQPEMERLLAACYRETPGPWSATALRRGLLNWRETEQKQQERLNPHGLC